jgi:hypothetical protein
MKLHPFNYLLLGIAIAFAGCSQKSQNGKRLKSEGIKPESAHGAPSSAPTAQTDLRLTPPGGWISETPSSSTRKAQYKLQRAEGDTEDAELVVYYFAGGGGTPQANVDRWIGQFTGPDGKPASTAKIAHKTVDGIPLTIVDVSGTYSSSMGSMQMGGHPKQGFRLLGAIAEAAGSGPWFVKLTGPERTVGKWQDSFQAFLDSIKRGS